MTNYHVPSPLDDNTMISPCLALALFGKRGYPLIPLANHHHPYKNHHNFGTKSPIFGHIPCLGVAKTLDLSVVTFIMDALADREGFTNSQFERCKKSFEHFDVNGDVDSWGCLSIGKVRRNKGTNVVELMWLNHPLLFLPHYCL